MTVLDERPTTGLSSDDAQPLAPLEWKTSPTGVVEADDTGAVTAIVSVTGIVDEVQDVIVPHAYDETLKRRTPKIVWSHDIHTWVARVEAIEELYPGDKRLPTMWKGRAWPKDAGALVVQCRFNLGSTAGRDAYSNVVFFDAGPIKNQVEWSVGYNSIPAFTQRKGGLRYLLAIDLFEACPTLFGAASLAGTISSGTKAALLEGADALPNFGLVAPALIGAELKVAGKEVTPKDAENTERLKEWWEHGGGADIIRWGVPGDFKRCETLAEKYLPPQQIAGWCLAGETLITTPYGPKRIDELAELGIGTVLAPSTVDDAKRGLSRVVRRDGMWREVEVRSFGEQRLLTLTLERHGVRKIIRATPEHEWFASPDGRTSSRYTLRKVRTEALRPGNVLGSLLLKPNLARSRPSPSGIAAGMVFGDGYDAGRVGARVDLWGDKDAALLPYFVGHPLGVCKGDDGMLGTRVSGLPRSWKYKPDLTEGVGYLYGWLAGYVAADGTVGVNGNVTLASARKSDLEFAAVVARNLGIETHDIRSHVRLGRGQEPTPLYRMNFVGATVPADLLIISEHRKRWDACTERASRTRQTPVRWKVVSVEDHGDVEEVFCAVVPGPESFALDGAIWTHNCANRHHGATGAWPGHAPGEEAASAAKKVAEKKGTNMTVTDTTPEAAALALLDSLEGKAKPEPVTLPDGSYPIADVTALKKAVKAFGRAKNKPAAKRHIVRRASALDAMSELPDAWSTAKSPAFLEYLDTKTDDTGDGGLADAVAEMETEHGDDETAWPEAAVDDLAVTDDAAPVVPPVEGADLSPDDGDAEAAEAASTTAAELEGKASKTIAELAVGEHVIGVKAPTSVDPAATVSGEVTAVKAKGDLTSITINTGTETKSVWLMTDSAVEVKFDPYAEIKTALQMVAERKDFPYLTGSVEERTSQIRQAVRDLLMPEPVTDAFGNPKPLGCYVSVDATFADFVVATLDDYSQPGPDVEQCFAVPYSIDADGNVNLGQPVPVEKQVVLVPDTDYVQDQAALAAQGITTPNVPTGAVPSMTPLAMKVNAQAKALLTDLEAKAAAGVELSGTHMRRLKAAHDALHAVCAGLGMIDGDDSTETKTAVLTPTQEAERLLLIARAQEALED